MKKSMIAALLACSLATVSPMTNAGITPTDVGIKLSEKLLSAVLGKGVNEVFDAIFGGGNSGLTLADVQSAINDAFAQATVQDIVSAQQALTQQLGLYNPEHASVDSVERILLLTSNLAGLIEGHISKNNSEVALPAFIMTWNVRLAFVTERYRLTKLKSDKAIVAQQAIEGLTYLNRYLRNSFADSHRNDSPCIAKDTNTHLQINGAIGSNLTEKNVNVATWYCYGNGRVIKQQVLDTFHGKRPPMISDAFVVNLGGSHVMRTTDLGKAMHQDLWSFAARMNNNEYKYFLEEYPSEEFANMKRNSYFISNYHTVLGDLRTNVGNWLDIVKHSKANDDQQSLTTALKLGMQLGMSWTTLSSHYNDVAFNNYLSSQSKSYQALGIKSTI